MVNSLNPSTILEWSTCTSVGGQSMLVISGTASLTAYEALLRTVQYQITALEPDKTVPVRQLEVSI